MRVRGWEFSKDIGSGKTYYRLAKRSYTKPNLVRDTSIKCTEGRNYLEERSPLGRFHSYPISYLNYGLYTYRGCI